MCLINFYGNLDYNRRNLRSRSNDPFDPKFIARKQNDSFKREVFQSVMAVSVIRILFYEYSMRLCSPVRLAHIFVPERNHFESINLIV